MGRSSAIVGFVAYLVVLSALTLGLDLDASPDSTKLPNLFPLHSIVGDTMAGGSRFYVNILGNLVAFLPVGLLWPAIRSGRASALEVARIGGMISLVIEVLQYRSGRRIGDIDDVLLNAAGSVLGYALVRLLVVLGKSLRRVRAGSLSVAGFPRR